ncbi:MAG TPA: FtsX-like permease family protein [Puia sp.]|nr:FtsX-like permease family protein [Puia sp.]
MGARSCFSASLPLQPLADIHFDPRYLNNTITYTTSRETYYILSAVALLIILIACINFINLATAQAIARAREVGVRKVLGSGRSQLIRQFLGETAFMVFIALVLAILLILLCLPQLAAWLDLKISVAALANPQMVASVLVATFLVILIAGLYPAFIQSGFRPIESLKSKPVTTKGSLGLRKTLVVVQFAISQAMIVGTLVVAYQMDFFQNRNLGYDKELVISMRTPDFEKSAVFKQELESTPGVSQTSFSSGSPANASQFCPFIAPQFGVTQDDVTELRFMDENFIPMFDIQLLAGNPIVKNAKTWKDSVYDIVVNEALIHKLGIMDPHRAIGQPITVNGNWSCTISGVVADFQSESKHKKIRPCVMLYRSDAFGTVCVRLAPGNLKNTIASIDKSWSTLSPDGLFTFEFMDDHIAEWYRQENKEYVAFRLFAGIAILIGCLGLYGLISFAVAQRTKEIGIRKVLGASVTNIVYLFSRNFIWLIGLAFLIAAPLAYLVMHNWLRGFAYQINIGPNIFLISLGVSGVIAALTISYQTIKAGISNPVKSLRTE